MYFSITTHVFRSFYVVALKFEFKLSVHDVFDHLLCEGFLPGKGLDRVNHLSIGNMFVLERFSLTVVNVVLSRHFIQPVNAAIPSGQSLFQMSSRSRKIMVGEVKFNACFSQKFLNVRSASVLKYDFFGFTVFSDVASAFSLNLFHFL